MTDLPAHWRTARLDDVADIVVGQSPPSSTYNTGGVGRPFFQGSGEFGPLYPTVEKWTTHDKPKVARQGAVLLSVRAPVGPTNVAPFDCAIGRGLVAIHAMERYDQSYLLWALRHLAEELARAGSGSTFNSVRSGQVRKLEVPVPPLAEQLHIVETIERMLSHLDAASAGLARLHAKQQQLERAQYANFYREACLAAGEVTVGDLLKRIEAGKSYKCPGHVAAPDKLGVLKLGAVTWGEYDETENKELPPGTTPDPRWEVRVGDLLIGRANTADLVGATALVQATRPGLYLSDKTLRLVPRSGVPARWVKASLAAPQSRRAMSAVATGTSDSMRNISQSKIRALAVPDVPADALERLDALESGLVRARRLPGAVTGAVEHAQVLRRSILKAAFEGRLTNATNAAPSAEDLQEAIA